MISMEDEERKNPKPKLVASERESKRVKRSTIVIPHDLVETILEKLPIKSLVKFKCVSKEWKSTIMSQRFKKRHLMIYQRSHDPNIFFIRSNNDYRNPSNEIYVNTLTLRSSVVVENHTYYPFSERSLTVVTKSCDGLICIYGFMQSIYVINPSIRWYRNLPLASLQKLLQDRPEDMNLSKPLLGLGKDKINGVYKLVWLYNSKEFGLDNTTTCEVFSFNTNTWRNVTASPYQIDYYDIPTYNDGSLHWLSQVYNSERHIVSFDLYTETFEVNLKLPFTTDGLVSIASLNDRLCISETKYKKQEIWSLTSGKEWEKTYSIDLDTTSIWLGRKPILPTQTISTFEKTKIVLKSWKLSGRDLVIHNQELNSCGFAYRSRHRGIYVSYFPSLITV